MASNTAGGGQVPPVEPPRRRADIWTLQGFLGTVFGLLLSNLAAKWWSEYRRYSKQSNLPEHTVTVKSYDTEGNQLSEEMWIMRGTDIARRRLLSGSALPTGCDMSTHRWLLLSMGAILVVSIAIRRLQIKKDKKEEGSQPENCKEGEKMLAEEGRVNEKVLAAENVHQE